MINRILVPTDFSPVAANALRYALHFAAQTNAEVHLINVIGLPVMDAYFVASSYMAFTYEMEDSARALFEKLKKKFYKGAESKFRSTIVQGDVYNEINAYAKKEHIDLIIMGTSGASGLEEVFFGSTAAAIASRSEIPVLIIPPEAAYHQLKHIVYATDHNEPEFPAVSRLMYMAELYDARVTVLHVKSEYDNYFDADKNFFVRNQKHISYKRWKMVKLRDKNVMEGIDRYITENKTDLLVLAKHKRSFFDRIFHRSLSKRMAYHIHIPLLILSKQAK